MPPLCLVIIFGFPPSRRLVHIIRCSSCTALLFIRLRVCSVCGFRFRRKNKKRQVQNSKSWETTFVAFYHTLILTRIPAHGSQSPQNSVRQSVLEFPNQFIETEVNRSQSSLTNGSQIRLFKIYTAFVIANLKRFPDRRSGEGNIFNFSLLISLKYPLPS